MRWKTKQPEEWHKWFAWHPVDIEGETVWLETVLRKEICNGYDAWYLYKESNPNNNVKN